jgi:SAM-dependent methyltransferase
MSLTAYNDILGAYQGVEQLGDFTDEQLTLYRQQLLDRTASQAAFIAQRTPADASVIDIGTGNGRLLIALAAQCELHEALGMDISESRIDFARKWAQDLGLDRIRFDTADVLTSTLPAQVDVVACITGTFAYFDAIQSNAGAQLLGEIRNALKPGGVLILELYPHSSWRRMLDSMDSHELRVWQELPEGDPWQFYLSHLRFSPNTQILTHHKTFVHRTTGEIDEGRKEHIRLYDQSTIRTELQTAGYRNIAIHGDWTGRTFQTDDEQLIVTAHRP